MVAVRGQGSGEPPAGRLIGPWSNIRLGARIDCNRGSGTWKSPEKGRLELGPMAMTRAMCPPGSLHDRIVNPLPFVRSYLIKDGDLFLSLMADGGIYEFEPR